jgi:hypothetical protein
VLQLLIMIFLSISRSICVVHFFFFYEYAREDDSDCARIKRREIKYFYSDESIVLRNHRFFKTFNFFKAVINQNFSIERFAYAYNV